MDALDIFAQQVADKPGLRLRQATVVSADASYTATIQVAGSTSSVSGVKYLTGAAVIPGNSVWVATDGRDMVILGQVEKGWKTYTPTITSGSGTITTASAAGRWTRAGNTITVAARCTITTVGTGAGSLNLSLPVAAANGATGYAGSGREHVTSGNALQVYVAPAATVMNVYLYTGGTPIVANYQNNVTVTYEAA